MSSFYPMDEVNSIGRAVMCGGKLIYRLPSESARDGEMLFNLYRGNAFTSHNPPDAIKDANRTHPETGETILTELPQTVMLTPYVP